jgi:hypothetical protein
VTYRARLTRPRLFGLLGSTTITTGSYPCAQSALIDLVALTVLKTGKSPRPQDRMEVGPSHMFSTNRVSTNTNT